MDFRQWSGDEPDPHPEGRWDDAPLALCDECGGVVTLTLAGVGQFCSRRCADIGEAKFVAHAKRRGWTEVQPDLLAHASGEK